MIIYFADRAFNILGLASDKAKRGYNIENDEEEIDVETGVATFSFDIYYKKYSRKEVERLTYVGNYILRKDENEYKAYTIIDSTQDTENSVISIRSEDMGLDLINDTILAFNNEQNDVTDNASTDYAVSSGWEDGYINGSGNKVDDNSYWMTSMIGIEPKTVYHLLLQQTGTSNLWYGAAFYNNNEQFISNTRISANSSNTTLMTQFTSPNNAYFVRLMAHDNWKTMQLGTSRAQWNFASSCKLDKGYVKENGAWQANNSYRTTTYLGIANNVENYQYAVRKDSYSSRWYGETFYDTNKHYIGGYQSNRYVSDTSQVTRVEIPAGAKYVRLSFHVDFTDVRFVQATCLSLPISSYVNNCIANSGFEIGLNEFSEGDKEAFAFPDPQTASERLNEIKTDFGAELSYSFEFSGFNITKKLINIHQKRGADNRVELRTGRDVKNIRITRSLADMATAILAVGKYVDSNGNEQSFTLNGNTGDWVETGYPVEGDLVTSTKAYERWSRFLSASGRVSGHIKKIFEYNCNSYKTLYTNALKDLKTIEDASVEYEVELYTLPPSVGLGDTIYVVDDEGEIYISARVLNIRRSRCNDTVQVTLGDYKTTSSGIADNWELLKQQFIAWTESNRQYYIWTAYADDNQGTGISLDPTGKNWMGLADHQKTENVDLSDPSIFNWIQLTAKDGTDGVGIRSTTVTYATSSSPNVMPGDSDWGNTIPVVAQGEVLWVRTVTDYTDTDIPDTATYTYSIQGVDGSDGVSVTVNSIMYVSWPTNQQPPDNAQWQGTVPAVMPGDYLWTRTIFSDGSKAYGLARQGEDGESISIIETTKIGDTTTVEFSDGTTIDISDGVDGQPGAKGDTGPQGPAGDDGRGVSETVTEYYLSTSDAEQTGGSWTTTPPEYIDGRYYWTRDKVTWTNPTEITYTTAVLDNALNSANSKALQALDRRLHNNYILPLENIAAGKLICGTFSGYKAIAENVQFDINVPILVATVALTANIQSTAYEAYPGINATTTAPVTGLAINKTVWLKVRHIAGSSFVIAPIDPETNESFLLCTTPTTNTEYYYIPLGLVANDSTAKMYFVTNDRLYGFIDGAFQPLDTASVLSSRSLKSEFQSYTSENNGIISGIRTDVTSVRNDVTKAQGDLSDLSQTVTTITSTIERIYKVNDQNEVEGLIGNIYQSINSINSSITRLSAYLNADGFNVEDEINRSTKTIVTPDGLKVVNPSKLYRGTEITGTSETPTVFSSSDVALAYKGDIYLNTDTSYLYICDTGGKPEEATWVYLPGTTVDTLNPKPGDEYLTVNNVNSSINNLTIHGYANIAGLSLVKKEENEYTGIGTNGLAFYN